MNNSSSWIDMPLAGFDLETTGVAVTDRVVTASILRVDGSEVRASNFLANPGVPIPAEATAVHGYATEYAEKYGRPHADVVADVVEQLYACWDEGRCVAVFNGSFDCSMIAAHYQGFEVRGPIFDAHVADKRYDKYRKGSRKLSAVCIHYGIRLDGAHDAHEDALAAARLAYILPRRFPELASMTAGELMTAQTNWHTEQTASFAAYLQKQGKPTDDLRYGWPITQRDEAVA